MINDLLITIYWITLISVIGIIAFPIAFKLLNGFEDRGWALAKALGIVLISYFVFISGSLRAISFGPVSIWSGIALVSLISFNLSLKNRSEMAGFIKDKWKLILLEEMLFAIPILFWSLIKGYQPDINGLEKFMDYGFLNSILKTRFFPPPDMWMAGKTINYYYFGHLSAAVLTKFSAIQPFITYNLMIATILGLSFSSSFSIGCSLFSLLLKEENTGHAGNLGVLSGMFSALVLNFGGNLHTVFQIMREGVDKYWYPDATRFIPFTIHEFPLYSYVVSDLHGHVSDIPYVILITALILNLFFADKLFSKKSLSQFLLINAALIALLIGVLYMTNALDAVIYLSLFTLLYMVFLLGKLPIIQIIIKCVSLGVCVGLSAIVFSLPFHLSFSPFAKGIGLVSTRSEVWRLLILWGFFGFISLVQLGILWLKHREKMPWPNKAEKIILTIMAFCLFLIVIPEFVYIKDIYIAEYHRANTMFKLVYQAFILMSIVTGPVVLSLGSKIFNKNFKKYKLLLFIMLVIIWIGSSCVLIYPYFAIKSYYNQLREYRGLNGLSWMQNRYPNDYAGLVWLNNKIKYPAIILEAIGESYTDFARISANSGLQTIVGWRVHEWLWRGKFDEIGKRTSEVAVIYNTRNIDEACRLLGKYAVEYIFVGSLERDQYPNLDEDKFKQIGSLLFKGGSTKIYQVYADCGEKQS